MFSNAGGQPALLCYTIYHDPVTFDLYVSRIQTGSTFQAELMYAPDGTPSAEFQSMAVRVGGAANFGPTAGFFSGGGRTVDSIAPAGGFGLFQVRVWSTANGTSYNDLVFKMSGYVGQSRIIRVDTANPLIGEPPVSLVGAGLGQIVVTASGGDFWCDILVPEPSTVALGIVGGAALLLAIRRKSACSISQARFNEKISTSQTSEN